MVELIEDFERDLQETVDTVEQFLAETSPD